MKCVWRVWLRVSGHCKEVLHLHPPAFVQRSFVIFLALPSYPTNVPNVLLSIQKSRCIWCTSANEKPSTFTVGLRCLEDISLQGWLVQMWYIWPVMHLDCSGLAGVWYIVHQLVPLGKTCSPRQDSVIKTVGCS